jgi:hypothetical protein
LRCGCRRAGGSCGSATAPRFFGCATAWAADPTTRAAQREARYGFNYGDAIELIEPAHWRRFGLVLLTIPEHDHCQVDHDDVLVAADLPAAEDG